MAKQHPIFYRNTSLLNAILIICSRDFPLTENQIIENADVAGIGLSPKTTTNLLRELCDFGVLTKAKAGFRLTELGEFWLLDETPPEYPVSPFLLDSAQGQEWTNQLVRRSAK